MIDKLYLKMMFGGKLRNVIAKRENELEDGGYDAVTIYFHDNTDFNIIAVFDYNEDIVDLGCFVYDDEEDEYEDGDEVKKLARFALKSFKSIEEPDIAYILNDFRAFEKPEYTPEPEPEAESDTESFGEPMEIPEGW